MNLKHALTKVRAAAAAITMLFAAVLPLACQSVLLDSATKRQVIEQLSRHLRTTYVFPETAEKMSVAMRANLDRGDYAGVSLGSAFASRLSTDLRAISHDKHLGVRYSAATLPDSARLDKPDETERARARAGHFGFVRTEILPGNVALLELRGFEEPVGEVRDTAIAAMKRLAGADALIVDLRRNGGGEPLMVALLSSQLWAKGKRIHLNDLYWRPANRTDQFWTDPNLAVPRITGPVFTVTSSFTFSAAEEYVSNLKHLRRATQVGETTGGGANPGGPVRLNDHFMAFVPSGRAVNPVTKRNWEGVGNIPEIAVSRDSALTTAYRVALQRLQTAAKTDLQRTALGNVLKDLANGAVKLP